MEAAKAQEPAKPDPKAGAGAAADDLSMEEILHSIRKIIAEDDTDGKKPNGKNGEGNALGSDVLELTEMLPEDGAVMSAKPGEAAAKPAAAPAAPGLDALQNIDQALASPPPAPVQPPAPAITPVAAPAAAPVAMPTAPSAPVKMTETLLSGEATTEAAASLTKLKTVANPEPSPVTAAPSPVFASGATVEQMVMESLKPMLKSWLDANLPAIVQYIVEREVKKLTK